MRHQLKENYQIDQLSKDIKVYPIFKKEKGYNYFFLKYPYWTRPKKDGTRDLRTKDNPLIYPDSIFYFKDYKIECDNPFGLYKLVLYIRNEGFKVRRCKEETEKRLLILKNNQILSEIADVDHIIEYYEKNNGF